MDYTRGEQVYKYQLIDRIGGGNFGSVWTAQDLTLKTFVAVKLLDQAQYSIDERLLEAQIGNRLQHANVVNIKGADVINKNSTAVVAISMPFYKNGSIQSKVNSLNFIDLKSSIKCIIDILRGLEYLHENGYYHCDIKPNNILIGDKGEYILSDYGITCFSPTHSAIKPRHTYLPHEAPETAQYQRYDARTDIYQMGITAFRLINGIALIKNDFMKDRTKFYQNVIQGKVITDSMYNSYVPHVVRKIINRSISVDPDDRYQTALEMRRDFERLSFVGNCSADTNGNLIVYNKANVYRYDIESVGNRSFKLYAFKKNKKSGIETRYAKYCKNNLSNKELKKYLQLFLLEIITGKKSKSLKIWKK